MFRCGYIVTKSMHNSSTGLHAAARRRKSHYRNRRKIACVNGPLVLGTTPYLYLSQYFYEIIIIYNL